MSHHKTFVALLSAALLLPTAVLAQDAGNEAEAAEEPTQKEKRQELVQQYQKTVKKLQQIRDEAVTENPSLQEQSRTYEDRIEQAIKDSGYDLEAGREKLKEMGGRFQDEDLSQEEREALAAEFQAERQKLQQAQQQASQQEEVVAAYRKLQENVITAMKEQDPQTEALMQRLRDLRQQLQAMEASNASSSQDG